MYVCMFACTYVEISVARNRPFASDVRIRMYAHVHVPLLSFLQDAFLACKCVHVCVCVSMYYTYKTVFYVRMHICTCVTQTKKFVLILMNTRTHTPKELMQCVHTLRWPAAA